MLKRPDVFLLEADEPRVRKLNEGQFAPGSPRSRKRAFGPNSGHTEASSFQASGSRRNRKTRGLLPSVARALPACQYFAVSELNTSLQPG